MHPRILRPKSKGTAYCTSALTLALLSVSPVLAQRDTTPNKRTTRTKAAAPLPVVGNKNQEELWIAASRTAVSITGNVALASNSMTISHKSFPLALVRDIDSQHLADAGRIVDVSQPSNGRLYRTLISRRSRFINGNTVCGPDADAKWILAVFTDRQMSLAFFSGSNEPDLGYTAGEVGDRLCGTYAYMRRSATDERKAHQ